jgi:release factor glutamine methyltransferase
MILKEVKTKFLSELNGLYELEEIENFFFILVEHYLHFNRLSVALTPEKSFSVEDLKPITDALQDLKKNIPIQYILGETEFYGFPVKVNKNVLIPRPETEELVDWILKTECNKGDIQLNILDIGTGSGCIAISISKKLSKANVYALDISEEALVIAKLNAEINDVDIQFVQGNILNSQTWNNEIKSTAFDIIVSNPPYIRKLEQEQMRENVLNYEPHLALFVNNEDPLQFYKAIAEYALKNLKMNGVLYFEINEYLGNQMLQLLENYNFNSIELKQDIFGKDRMIKAIK